MATARFAWGIDVGNRALKAVKLVRSPEGLRIDDVEVIEHEHILSEAGDNRESLIEAALTQFVQRHSAKGGAVAVGVSGQASFARFIKLPPVEPKKIPEIVRFEAIQQIPFPLDDVEWSYQLFQDEASPDVEVGIFAMRKELVNQHIKYFTDAGLNVQAVQMNPLAVYNAMYYDQRIKGTTMIVDLGAETTDLIIADGETIWLRSIPIGGNNFTEALVKGFKLKYAKAEELKRNAGTSKYSRQILQAMRPIFADLVAEIQRSIGFYASVHRESRIGRVLALGGTFRLPTLIKYLQQNLQLEVHRIDRLGTGAPADARLAALFNENILSSVSAYGLALQAMGEGKITSSLLPLEIRRARMWREKTKWFAAAAALIVACPVIAAGRYYYDQMKYDQQSSARVEIDRVARAAKDADNDWKVIQQSGDADRAQIAAIKSLQAYRDVWSNFVTDLSASIPEAQPELLTGNVEDIKKVPRAQRRQLVLMDMSSAYDPDLAPKLAKNDSDFSALAGQAPPVSGQRTMPKLITITPKVGPGKPGTGPRKGAGVQQGRGPKTPAAVITPSEDPSAKQRGYLITVHFVTPNADYNAIAASLTKSLLEKNPGPTDARKPYAIQRVTLARARKVDPSTSGQPTITGSRAKGAVVPKPKPGDVNAPGVPGSGVPGSPGGVPALPGTGAPRDPSAPGAAAGIDPYAMPARGVKGGQKFDVADPTKDPVTGEDRTQDNDLLFLVAIVLDPQAPAAPAPSASARE